MKLEERISLITKNSDEVISEEEIRTILETKSTPRAYIGFELSGFLHLGTGVICGNKFKSLATAGLHTIVFLADWHSYINNKLGAAMDKIQIAGEYFKKAFESVGVKNSNIQFIWGNELVSRVEYWEKILRVAKASTLSRIMRTLPIMGRSSEGEIESAFIFYPSMQVADIFEMEIDIACGGMDQRKAHMLARDVAPKLGYNKPVCVHTPLLTGLQGMGEKMDTDVVPDLLSSKIDAKMSKSKPDTCIFIHDTEEEIKRKIKKAVCPPQLSAGNPIIEIMRYILFEEFETVKIERSTKFGGDIVFSSFANFEREYLAGTIHPLDVKSTISRGLIHILSQPRAYFEKHSDIIAEMKQLQALK